MINTIKPREKLLGGEVKVITKHLGQKRSYGDSYYEYYIHADGMDRDSVYKITQENCRKCNLSNEDYQREYKENRTASNHFRERYYLTQNSNGVWFYQVVWPWTG